MDIDAKVEITSSADHVARGVYRRGSPSDLRSPCPMINCLANHGYLPRDGRKVHRSDFYSAIRLVGLSPAATAMFAVPIFVEHNKSGNAQIASQRSFLAKVLYYVRHPLAILLSRFGMLPHGQVDSTNKAYLDLDQLALHDAVEHDVSLSRRDFAQGDNLSPQKDLIADILAASSDGDYVTIDDLAKLRKQRIATQKLDNKALNYGNMQHELGCGELALILKVLGDGSKVKREYLEAFFAEERLPLEEGWKLQPNRWWKLGMVELKLTTNKIKKLIPY